MMKRVIFAILLIIYSALLIKVMVFKDLPTIRIGGLMLNFSGTEAGRTPNFIPFSTILPYLLGYKGFIIASINLLGNIALLVPIGFFVPFLFRNMTWKKSLILSFASGFSIEIMQELLGVGIFDIDDILLNALGVMTGFWAFVYLTKWIYSRNYKNIIIAALIIVAASATYLYLLNPKGGPSFEQRSNPGSMQSDTINREQGGTQQGPDPCGGTGGTGQITTVESFSITIRRNDGIIQTIKFTDHTTIRTSAGPASLSDLKAGENVTLVIDESQTASLILICNASRPK
jgi:glycopeptide antibiotics resistance protein